MCRSPHLGVMYTFNLLAESIIVTRLSLIPDVVGIRLQLGEIRLCNYKKALIMIARLVTGTLFLAYFLRARLLLFKFMATRSVIFHFPYLFLFFTALFSPPFTNIVHDFHPGN